MNKVYVLTVENTIPDCEPFEVVGVYDSESSARAELERQYDSEYETCKRYNEIQDHFFGPRTAYIETDVGEVDFSIKECEVMTEVTELCECGFENHLSVADSAWVATCKGCGKPMLLCDKCYSEHGSTGRGCVSGEGCQHEAELETARRAQK